MGVHWEVRLLTETQVTYDPCKVRVRPTRNVLSHSHVHVASSASFYICAYQVSSGASAFDTKAIAAQWPTSTHCCNININQVHRLKLLLQYRFLMTEHTGLVSAVSWVLIWYHLRPIVIVDPVCSCHLKGLLKIMLLLPHLAQNDPNMWPFLKVCIILGHAWALVTP